MKYSITGTAANGTPVSQLVDFPDEAAVMAYADSKGITLTSIRPLRDQSAEVAVDNVPRHPDRRSNRMRTVSFSLFVWGWICLLLGPISLVMAIASRNPIFAIGWALFSLAFFLFLLGAIYSVGASIVAAIEEKQVS